MTWGTAYLETRVLSADPVDLIVISYEFATLRVHEARSALAKKDIAARCRAISRTIAILGELESSLDYKLGGEIAYNLGRLYGYMREQLIRANLRQEDGPLAEVESLLGTLGEAWRAISSGPADGVEASPEGEVPGEWNAFALMKEGAGHSAQGWSA
jgi:flagellar protein FliS